MHFLSPSSEVDLSPFAEQLLNILPYPDQQKRAPSCFINRCRRPPPYHSLTHLLLICSSPVTSVTLDIMTFNCWGPQEWPASRTDIAPVEVLRRENQLEKHSKSNVSLKNVLSPLGTGKGPSFVSQEGAAMGGGSIGIAATDRNAWIHLDQPISMTSSWVHCRSD